MSRINLAISGPPRNGTSALRRFLNVDPRIMVLHEANIFGLWNTRTFNAGTHKLKLNLNLERPDYSGPFTDKGLDINKFFETARTKNFTGNQLLEYFYNNSSATVVGDKNPVSYVNTAKTILTLPNTKLIIIVRDGRDAICSYVRHAKRCIKNKKGLAHWMHPTVEQAQHVWINTLRQIWAQAADGMAILRFEDVTTDKAAFVEGIQKFLGLEYQPINDDNYPHYAPFGPVRMDTWKEEIPDIMSKVNDEFLHYMKEFDYI